MSETPEHIGKLLRSGVALQIHTAYVAEHWAEMEAYFLAMEGHTQLCAAQDLKAPLIDGRMTAFGAQNADGSVSMAIAGIFQGSKGQICRSWLLALPNAQESIVATLADECEIYARLNGCIVLEIDALPCWAARIAGKVTAVMMERDLREPRKGVN